jgi:hypothetical protein
MHAREKAIKGSLRQRRPSGSGFGASDLRQRRTFDNG